MKGSAYVCGRVGGAEILHPLNPLGDCHKFTESELGIHLYLQITQSPNSTYTHTVLSHIVISNIIIICGMKNYNMKSMVTSMIVEIRLTVQWFLCRMNEHWPHCT